MRVFIFASLLGAMLCFLSPAQAQLINGGTGNINSGDSFSEFIGGNWGVSGPGWFFNFGGGAPGGGAAPPFGGVPGGLSGGFGFRGGGGLSGGFGFTAGQGYSSSLGGTSGSITSLNGTPGFLFNGTLTPFVTEIIPVVGSPSPAMIRISPLQLKLQQAGGIEGLRAPRPPEQTSREERSSSAPGGLAPMTSSAERGDFSVSAIRRQQAAEEAGLKAELDHLIAEADRLEAGGDYRGAALQYSKAAAKVEGVRRQEFVLKARELRAK